MVEIKEYYLPPTTLIPNSPYPLLHYKGVFPKNPSTSQCNPTEVYTLFTKNTWSVQWIFRYGPTQPSHYHSHTHECMAVLSGTATIRFGVADTSPDMRVNTHSDAHEDGGIELRAEVGDVFIIPAGVAHKTFDGRPDAEFKLLSPGTGHGIEGGRRAVEAIGLEGFTMMGAYPPGGEWDFVVGGGEFERVWSVLKPVLDPVFGDEEVGLVGRWKGSGMVAS